MNTETISDNENTEQTEAETVLGSMPDFEDFKEGEEAKKELANILDELNYSEELRDVLENVVPAIAEFYNDYETIFKVLKECSIHIVDPDKRVSDTASEVLGIEDDSPFHVSGAAINLPRKTNNGEVEITRAIFFKNSEYGMQTLVHELCHQVASINEEPIVGPDGKVTVNIGLSSEIYEDVEDDKYMKEVRSDYTYLEEMVNACDTEDIMKKIFGDDYRSSEYGALVAVARKCPDEVLAKLREIRHSNNSPDIVRSQESLVEVSQLFNKIMNIYGASKEAKELAGGDKEKADKIKRELRMDRLRKSVNLLTEWAKPSENIAPEAWTDFPETGEGVDERPDIDGVPQTLWRGERLYLNNIDSLGTRDISTIGHEDVHNRNGETFCSRDKKLASLYAVGTDGVTFYDGELPVEEIPIGVVYKIDNSNNKVNATPTDEEPDEIGPYAGKFREFTTSDPISPDSYTIDEIYIMDDFDQPNGHTRSDFRRPREVYKVNNMEDLPKIIEAVKKRMAELDQERKKKGQLNDIL